MFGLTKREQRWKAEQLAAETLAGVVKAALHAKAQVAASEVHEEELEALRAENARLQEESRILRYLLAMSHEGKNHRIYGDDGELQCPTCWVDFVRDSAQDIKRKIEEAGMRELRRAIEAGDWPPKKVDLEN